MVHRPDDRQQLDPPRSPISKSPSRSERAQCSNRERYRSPTKSNQYNTKASGRQSTYENVITLIKVSNQRIITTWLIMKSKATSKSISLTSIILLPLQHVLEPVGRFLWVSHVRLKVHVNQTKPRSVTQPPLEVIEERPCKVSDHRRTIIHRPLQLSDVALVEVDPLCVAQTFW